MVAATRDDRGGTREVIVVSRIHVMKPWFGDEEALAVAEVIRTGWVAQGPRVAEFEAAFAVSVGAAEGVAVSSCTTALHLALAVADLPVGCDVVVPSFSFIATTNAATYVGARPVFCDVDERTGNVTAELIEAVLTPQTRAVIAVDQGGIPVELEEITALCRQRNILVVEDAACAAGSRYRGRPVGARAPLAAWSFHPRKLLTTGEGGMLTTDDPEVALRARRLREHGMSISAAERHASTLPPAEQYLERGFNYRMTDLQAAIGLVQLARLPEMVRRRREVAAAYTQAFADVPGLRCVTDPPHGTSNFQSFWVEVGVDFPLSRDELLAHLADREISARRGIMAAHRQPAYAGHPHGPLPVTERLTDRTLILPIFHQMSDAELNRVIDSVREAGGSW